MKIQNLLYLCAIFFLSAANSFALGKAYSMGNLQTVVPDGPFDTARNPALLAFQTSSNSTGLFLNYVSHIARENSASAERHQEFPSVPINNSSETNVKIEDPKIKAYNAYIANSIRFKSSTLGFSFVNNGNDQYSIEERKISSITSGTINNPSISFYQKSNEKSEKTDLNPAFIASVGFNISNKSSLGFQILLKYSDSTEKKEYYEYFEDLTNLSYYEKNEKLTKEINVLSGELGFGYVFRADNTEIGLLIKSGDFSWIKKSLTADTYRIQPAIQKLSTEDDISLNGKNTSGPSIAAGCYKRFNSFFALALESTFTVQNSFTDKELDLDDPRISNTKVKIKKNTQTTKNSVLFNGGTEFNLTKDLSLNCGLGFLNVAVEGGGSDDKGRNRQETNINYGLLTIGLDYILTKNIDICLTAAGISYSIDAQRHGQAEDETVPMTEDNLFKMKSKGYYLHTGLGVTMSF